MDRAKDFGTWLDRELDRAGMNQTELAAQIGVQPAQVSRIISGNRTASNDTYRAIARALKLPPEQVLRAAGVLPEKPRTDAVIEELLELAGTLPPEDVQELIDLARVKLERREQAKRSRRTV